MVEHDALAVLATGLGIAARVRGDIGVRGSALVASAAGLAIGVIGGDGVLPDRHAPAAGGTAAARLDERALLRGRARLEVARARGSWAGLRRRPATAEQQQDG